MNIDKFKEEYSASRNGVNGFYQHPLFRYFVYSDGVRECALAGCYWLLDQLAPMCKHVFAKHQDENLLTISLYVNDTRTKLTASGSGDVELDAKTIDYTDMPNGKWNFLVSNDGDGVLRMILVTEY